MGGVSLASSHRAHPLPPESRSLLHITGQRAQLAGKTNGMGISSNYFLNSTCYEGNFILLP